ncbi:sugar ABC transporter substrate-binding protein [Rhodanobacter denitrificans]|uniref:sugar ABC transporter substrate-binding protein n=1 Tax=Rhodanobacter denitrificans TaxID=666685 RepID=UPI000260CC7F|nr:sugar ABC transporter substrate-binding protein [Rhodanobacter denitrificans]EIM00959.1 family 1 extracellular solute-binding protein [Rhodanobacter denitrificans]UJJ60137.1 sugar ABC transporter substrate-binding protein [Rhodanobacter denitrificans]UJM90293.1 sugar ABC transporter substrate-binding protein [Rhodanobacter denitrificans]
MKPGGRPRRPWRGRWLAAIAAGSVLLGGCSAAPAGHELTFWTIGREGEAIAQLLPAFERAHPDITVKVQQLPLTAAHQKLLTAFAGGSTPDLSQLGNTWLPELAALQALEPLQARVDASVVVQPRDYFGSIWATNVIDGTLYGVPWYVDTRLLFYRKDLLAAAGFAAPPRNWAEWRRQLAALSEPARHRYGILLPTNEYEQLMSLALQQSEPLLRDGGRYGNFESAGFKRALSFYVDTFKLQQAPAITNVEAGNPWTEFGRGVYAFYLSGPWNLGEFRSRLPASQQDDWATAPLPGPDGAGIGVAGGSSLVIFRASKHKDAAWQLIEYLSQPAVQQRFYELLGDLPPRRSSWQGAALRDDPKLRAFREQLEQVRPAPPVPEWERIANEMQLVAAEAIAGRLSIDQAAAEIDRRADAILAKRRWVLDHAHERTP